MTGFIGEGQPALSGRALTIKTHRFNKNMVGAILLLRNPYRAMVSEYNRREADKTGHAREKTFKTAGNSSTTTITTTTTSSPSYY